MAAFSAAKAGRAMPEICILTPEPGYYEMTEGPAAEYRALFGENLVFRPWTHPGDLTGFLLIMPLLAWGYHLRAPAWFGALDSWETLGLPMANQVGVLRWNSDKQYLIDLDIAGVPTVPTVRVQSLSADDLHEARSCFGTETLIVKPPISGGADRTYMLAAGDPIPPDVLARAMLIQPMMQSIAEEGEYSLFYFGGAFSHAILKRPASGEFRVQKQFGGRVVATNPPAAALRLAESAIAATPETPLYARIDLIRGEGSGFMVMELELVEPELFLEHAPDGGKLFAETVGKRLSRL